MATEARDFDSSPLAVAAARHFAADTAARWGLAADDLMLLVSELASNAVVHARSNFRVALTATEMSLRVEVADDDPYLPSAHGAVPEDSLGGRGLQIVGALSSEWGVDANSRMGKTIWAVVPCAPLAR